MDIMELGTMLATSGGLTTLIGVFGAWQYRKQNKRLKEAEAKLAEVNVDKGRNEAKDQETNRLLAQIDHQQKTIDKYIERYDSLVATMGEREDQYQGDLKEWASRYTEQTQLVRKLNADVVDAHNREKQHIRHSAKLQAERDFYKDWHCRREDNGTTDGCDRREPKQAVPKKYIPLEEMCSKCDITDCSARKEERQEEGNGTD